MGYGITDLSTSYNQANLIQAVSTTMLAKSLASVSAQSAGLEQILNSGNISSPAEMELSVNPSVGANFDISV